MDVRVWFYGKDVILDLFNVLVLLLLVFAAWKNRRLRKRTTQYNRLIGGFSLLALAFIAKVLSHLVIYWHEVETKSIGLISITYREIEHSTAPFFYGMLAYRVLTLVALYLLYTVYAEQHRRETTLFILYLLILTGIFMAHVWFFFPLTVLILFLLIAIKIYKAYQQNHYGKTCLLLSGFTLLIISQLPFLFADKAPLAYITGEVLQLVGYILLLLVFLKVTYGAKRPH